MLAVGLSYSEIGKRLSSCANMGNVNTGPTEVPRPRHGARSGLPLKFVAQACGIAHDVFLDWRQSCSK